MQVTFRGKHLFRLVMSVSGMAIKFECCIWVCWKLQKNNVVVGSSRLFPFDQKKVQFFIYYELWTLVSCRVTLSERLMWDHGARTLSSIESFLSQSLKHLAALPWIILDVEGNTAWMLPLHFTLSPFTIKSKRKRLLGD